MKWRLWRLMYARREWFEPEKLLDYGTGNRSTCEFYMSDAGESDVIFRSDDFMIMRDGDLPQFWFMVKEA